MSSVKWLVASTLLFSSVFTRAPENDQRPDYPRALAFFHRIQNALQQNDRTEISRLTEYPLLTTRHGQKHWIRTRNELLGNFDQIFDSGVRCAVMRATDKDVWGNSRGFTVGSGAIWFDDVSPPGTNEDIHAPDFWTKGTFVIKTVNNGTNYCDLK
jgi:hypothetical protein